MICSDAAQTPGSPVAMNTAPSDERWGVFLDPRGASQHRLGVRCKPTDADEGRERMIDEKPGVTSSGLAEPSGLSIQVIEVVDGRYVEFAHDKGDQSMTFAWHVPVILHPVVLARVVPVRGAKMIGQVERCAPENWTDLRRCTPGRTPA